MDASLPRILYQYNECILMLLIATCSQQDMVCIPVNQGGSTAGGLICCPVQPMTCVNPILLQNLIAVSCKYDPLIQYYTSILK